MCHISFAGLTEIAEWAANRIEGGTRAYDMVHTIVFAVTSGCAAWGLFLWRASKEKAEHAEQISDSYWGFRLLVPLYLSCFLAMMGDSVYVWCFLVVAAFVGFVSYRRSIKIKGLDWLSLGIAFAVGVACCLILQ